MNTKYLQAAYNEAIKGRGLDILSAQLSICGFPGLHGRAAVEQARRILGGSGSPIETEFAAAARGLPGLKKQYQIGNYRVDFAIPAQKIAIEIDGHDYHSSRDQRAKDAQRDRDLQSRGWRVLRFTGQEIHHDAARCVREIKRMIAG